MRACAQQERWNHFIHFEIIHVCLCRVISHLSLILYFTFHIYDHFLTNVDKFDSESFLNNGNILQDFQIFNGGYGRMEYVV